MQILVNLALGIALAVCLSNIEETPAQFIALGLIVLCVAINRRRP